MAAMLTDVDLLARLVSFDTTSARSNLPCVEFLCDYLSRPGIRLTCIASADGQKVNLLAEVGADSVLQERTAQAAAIGSPRSEDLGHPVGSDRPGLMLCGHLDVVPAEEPGWECDPFSLADRGDRLVARGAADMKGFVAVAVNLLAEAAGWNLLHPLALLLTYDEEVGSLGVMRFAEAFDGLARLPRACVVGEPTGLRIVRMHKGHLKLRVELTGRAAHSAYPHLGASAIEPAGRVIVALAALREELERERCATSGFFPQTPYPALNVATIQGGSAVNVIPDRCVLTVGIRTLPGMDSAPLIERVRAAATSAAGHSLCAVELLNDNPPMLLREDTPLHRVLCELVGQTEGLAVSFASDAGVLSRCGFDCALFGPGAIEVAHQPNEWVPKDELKRAAALLRTLVRRMCSGSR